MSPRHRIGLALTRFGRYASQPSFRSAVREAILHFARPGPLYWTSHDRGRNAALFEVVGISAAASAGGRMEGTLYDIRYLVNHNC
jgi:hypothetical protein